MPILMVERGNDKGLSAKVEPAKPLVVGRENDKASIRLTDPMASRAHFQILGENGTWRIRDMKSRNGTLLNDEKLPPDAEREIRIGDKVQVGETIFSFLSDAKEESPGGGLIGKTIGGYQLLERVGRGGMGTVYRAEQISLKREVALKVLSAKLLSDPTFVEKFVQEARAAGGLIHPNIVQVIDVGSDRGIYYFSMEFMDHGSVGDIVAKDGPVPWERALEMLTDAAKGLIFAEKKGIIHRDIKPDNLMLTAEGTVKIGDLGLAKKADEATGEGGQIFGTPHFIAPEQAQGKPVDHRADLYALGATFYRVLTGKTPFSGDNVKEILLKQIQEEPKPIGDLVPDLPDEIGAVIGKLMKKKPDDRYRSAQGLYEDLERIRVRYHLEAHGQAASARRTKALLVVAVIGALALGGVAYHYAMKPAEVQIIDNTKPSDPNANNNSTIKPPDPAEVAARDSRDFLLKIKEDEIRLRGSLNGKGPADTWRTDEEKWNAIADRYEGLVRKFAAYPALDAMKEAEAKAKEIKEAIASARTAWNAEKERLEAALRTAVEAIDALVAEGKFARAAAEVEALRSKGRPALLSPEAREYLGDTPLKAVQDRTKAIRDAADAFAAKVLKAAADAAPAFPGKDYLDARRVLEASVPFFEPAPAAKDDLSGHLREHATAMRDAVAAGDRSALAAAAAAFDADEAAYFRAYLQIRRWNSEATPLPEETPFFDFRWDRAIGAWEALAKTLRTGPWKRRVALKIETYGRCRRLFETVGEMIRTRAIKDATLPDGNRFLDGTSLREKASAEGAWVFRLPGKSKEFFEYRELTPQEFFEKFLQKAEGIPFTDESRLDLAAFLAEAGEADSWTFLFTLPPGIQLKLTESEFGKWLKAEAAAANDYYGADGIYLRWKTYQEEKKGARPAEVEAKRAVILERLRAAVERDTWYTTDFAILHCSELGVALPKLMKDSERDDFLRTLGVVGAEGIPLDPLKEAERAPPPPPPPTDGTVKDGEEKKADGPPAPQDGGGAGPAKDPGGAGGGTETPK